MSRVSRFLRFGNPGKTEIKKYLSYALGEVLLIFIGISLALWFDNWNEDQKRSKMQIATLIEISEGLKGDIQSLKNDSIGCNRITQNIFQLADVLDSQQTYNESLDTLLLSPTNYIVYSFNISPYKLLESRGLDLITDKNLRQQISDLYSYQYNYIIQVSTQDKDANNEFFLNHYSKYIQYPSGNNPDKNYKIKPLAFEQLIHDAEMISLIRWQGWLMVRNQNHINRLLQQIRNLKAKVDTEIINQKK